jgi:uncharacterized protein (DUF433 family)
MMSRRRVSQNSEPPSATGIEATPGVCGGDACIAGTRIPVWLLEQARRLGATDADLLRAYPPLSESDLGNAWTYADSHRAEMEACVAANEDA